MKAGSLLGKGGWSCLRALLFFFFLPTRPHRCVVFGWRTVGCIEDGVASRGVTVAWSLMRVALPLGGGIVFLLLLTRRLRVCSPRVLTWQGMPCRWWPGLRYVHAVWLYGVGFVGASISRVTSANVGAVVLPLSNVVSGE